MHVPMSDLAGAYRSLQSEIDAAIQRVLDRGVLDWGPEVPAFEEEFAQWLGVDHAMGTNSGTAALKLALKALDIGPGDEVITVPNSDISTTSAVHHVGAKAVWVDVEPDTLNMDPDLVEVAITPRTKALLPVHLYGHPADMPALMEVARQHGLFVVEDACLAVGATIDGQPVGTWGEIACFSHAPSKHLGAFGSGGTAVTNDALLAERVRLYAGYGESRKRKDDRGMLGAPQHYVVEGLNERLDELQAAILRAKLPHLTEQIETRCENAEVYTQALRDTDIRPPVERSGYRHTFRNYIIRVSDRQRVQEALAEAEIANGLLYVPPLHLQPTYRELGHTRGDFPVTEEACASLISIPVGSHLTAAQRDFVIETLREREV